jgi:hypothetical protein
MIMIHTNYNCYKTTTYLLSTHSWLTISLSTQLSHSSLICPTLSHVNSRSLLLYGGAKSKFSYNWQSVCLAVKLPSGTQDQILITVRQLWVCWHAVPFLNKGWVCCLILLLALTSTVILRSKSLRTHDHILLSHIWDSPNMEGQPPHLITPSNKMAQL